MEKLAAYKLDLDLEIWEMQHKKQYEDEDSDEDEYVPMLKRQEQELSCDHDELKDCVVKLRAAIDDYEDEDHDLPETYFKVASRCTNETMNLIGMVCNNFQRAVKSNDLLLIMMTHRFYEIANPMVSIKCKREWLSEPEIGWKIMMEIKHRILPRIVRDLAYYELPLHS